MNELPHWNFDETHRKARESWNSQLQLIQVEDGNKAAKEVFYTALYHSMIAPSLYMDFDGRYMGFDKKIHKAHDFENYSTFSLWDTFRATHPLLTIIQNDRVNDMIKSMLAQYKEYGLLPVWPLQSSETNCMIGYHAVPVIVDAYLKGIVDFDSELAFEAIKKSAMQDEFDVQYLKKYNYIPRDLAPTISVARTLEYAFDDYCIAQMAKKMGKEEEYAYFSKRAKSYENLFDTRIGFMRGKNSDGTFREDFDPYNAVNANSDFIEGNSWQYTWFVPHNVQALIDGMGGRTGFVNRLDSLFNVSSVLDENTPEDVSGLIGQYAHGNEPSHHVAYLYNYAGAPWKTQEKIHEITTTLYDNTPSGLCGNEDCGQMSAWYVLSTLGFYPVNPAEGIYVIGKPGFADVAINVGSDKQFIIQANGHSADDIYIQSATLNGQTLERSWIRYDEIMDGGDLVFEMGSTPNKNLWAGDIAVPPSSTSLGDHHLMVK
jgi:predicted alpha-1,2-mannosidase